MHKDSTISRIENAIECLKAEISTPNTAIIYFKMGKVSLCFPGKSRAQAYQFTVFVRLCVMILANLKENRLVTSRDLYYKDVKLFHKQETVVRNIDKLSQALQVCRRDLNIVASPNGLMAADLTLVLENNEIVESKRANGATLIPVSKIQYVQAPKPPKFVLVVEKEAVFTNLQTILPEGIVVTGKGFPDRATRNLLQAISLTFPYIPMYALMDSDPHGILILHNYERGSERSLEPEFPLQLTYLGVSILDYNDGLVPQTANDMKLGVSTLKKDWVHQRRYEKCKVELQRGLFMGLKGEMNLLDQQNSTKLATYFLQKVKEEEQMADQTLFVNDLRLIIHDQKVCRNNKRVKVTGPKRKHHH